MLKIQYNFPFFHLFSTLLHFYFILSAIFISPILLVFYFDSVHPCQSFLDVSQSRHHYLNIIMIRLRRTKKTTVKVAEGSPSFDRLPQLMEQIEVLWSLNDRQLWWRADVTEVSAPTKRHGDSEATIRYCEHKNYAAVDYIISFCDPTEPVKRLQHINPSTDCFTPWEFIDEPVDSIKTHEMHNDDEVAVSVIDEQIDYMQVGSGSSQTLVPGSTSELNASPSVPYSPHNHVASSLADFVKNTLKYNTLQKFSVAVPRSKFHTTGLEGFNNSDIMVTAACDMRTFTDIIRPLQTDTTAKCGQDFAYTPSSDYFVSPSRATQELVVDFRNLHHFSNWIGIRDHADKLSMGVRRSAGKGGTALRLLG